VGANVDNVRRGIGTDSRIGKRFLFAGIGYGGSCFPKDVQALDYTSDEYGYNFQILKAVMEVNDRQKLSIVEKMKLFYKGDFRGKTFGVWGLAFKPETDDVREAPALYILKELVDGGAKVQAYDPEAIKTFQQAFGPELTAKVTFAGNRTEAMKGADALVICTEWNEFRSVVFDDMKAHLAAPVIFDGRNLYDLDKAEAAGVTYISVGRKAVYGA
jgi:UDPglucose 6-dehydrogenase